jgi:hypothetical protein
LGLLVEWEGEEGREGVRTHEKRTTAPEKRARGEVGSEDEGEEERGRGRGDEERRGEEEASQSLQSRRESKRIRKSNGGVVGVTGGVEGVGRSDDCSWVRVLGGSGNGNGRKWRGRGGTRVRAQGKKTCSSVCTPHDVAGGGGKETESVTEPAGAVSGQGGGISDQRGDGAASAKGGGGAGGGGGIKVGRVEVVWAHTSHR